MNLERKSKKELIATIHALQEKTSHANNGNGAVTNFFEYYFSQGEMLIIGIDSKNIIRFINHQAVSFLGNNDLIGRDFLKAFKLTDNKIVHEIIYHQIQKDSFLAAYHTGNKKSIIRVKNFIKDPNGLLYLMADIETEHQPNIQILKNATKPYIDLLNKSRDLIQVFTYKGKIRYINTYWKNKLGYDVILILIGKISLAILKRSCKN